MWSILFTTRLITSLVLSLIIATFTDPQRATDDLQTFAKMNEKRLYKLLRTVMDPQTDLKTLVKTTVSLPSFAPPRSGNDVSCLLCGFYRTKSSNESMPPHPLSSPPSQPSSAAPPSASSINPQSLPSSSACRTLPQGPHTPSPNRKLYQQAHPRQLPQSQIT